MWRRSPGSSPSLLWAHSWVCSQLLRELGAAWASGSSAGIPSLCFSSLSSFPQASTSSKAGPTTTQAPETEAGRSTASLWLCSVGQSKSRGRGQPQREGKQTPPPDGRSCRVCMQRTRIQTGEESWQLFCSDVLQFDSY